jgi:chemotaxis protein methyltransferase CheR
VTGEVGLESPELQEVARILARATGLSLASGLIRTLHNSLQAAAQELGLTPMELARKVIAADPEGVATLIEHAVVNETYFFRHPEQVAALARLLAPKAGGLRIWSAGCATGEEPYTVAMALLEAGRPGREDRIVATDVSERALAAARAGFYQPWALRRMPAGAEHPHFQSSGALRVADPVRALVEFRRQNLIADPPPPGGPFDAVLCRNVLIYFEPPTAAEILYRLVASLAPGGYLVLSPVELPLASPLALEWIEIGGGTVLRRIE